jgi:hypothetical protein
MALSRDIRLCCVVAGVLALSAFLAQAQDAAPAPPENASAGDVIEAIEQDAERIRDKAVEMGEGAGETAGNVADTIVEQAGEAYEWTTKQGEKAYEWSKRMLNDIIQ